MPSRKPLKTFKIDKIDGFSILRDDIIEGGTKRRALDILLKSLPADSVSYAGTIMGHGALALAHACADNAKTAHIHICANDAHPVIEKLRIAGARVLLHPPMPVATLHEYAKAQGGITFPPGFDMPEFEEALTAAVLPLDLSASSEIWTTSVTGTLTRALKRAFPDKAFKTVSVVKSGAGEFFAPEKYHQPAKRPPPYPACPYTDAKVWQFVREHAVPDALIWNTAG